MAFFLNAIKDNGGWPPFKPFTLTVKDAEKLYDFHSNRLRLAVVLDFDTFCASETWGGFDAAVSEIENYPIVVTHEKLPGFEGRLSDHILRRVGLECMSPDWVIASQLEVIKEGAPEDLKDYLQGSFETPEGK